jgi:prepilin-type N-terminal cleavage/methylation domain-containing protein
MRNKEMKMRRRAASEAGFSLIELMVAAVIFTIITGAAFSLFAQHQPIFKQQQNQAALNIAMRNAIAQIQEDVVNGGSGYYTGVNVYNWPVGVVISNHVVDSSSDCHTGTTYTSTCFDAFTVITVDPATTPVTLSADGTNISCFTSGTCGGSISCTGAKACTGNTVDTTGTQIYVEPPTGVTAATYKSNFHNGDHLLLMTNLATNYTEVTLSADATTQTVGGTTYVLLTHYATNSNGTNSAANDPTDMSVNASTLVTNQFSSTGWLARLTPVKYDVDTTTDTTNPTLRRTLLTGTTTTANGVPLVNQVIGFKVGAGLVGGQTGVYDFDSSTFGAGYDYTAIRSVMVSLIGRTAPNSPDLDPTFKFQNSFDGGHYQIQGVSVVVNPRNMSMSD